VVAIGMSDDPIIRYGEKFVVMERNEIRIHDAPPAGGQHAEDSRGATEDLDPLRATDTPST
jgi:hypothetical protein